MTAAQKASAAVVVPVDRASFLEQRYRQLDVDLGAARVARSWQAVAALERQRRDAFDELEQHRAANAPAKPMSPSELEASAVLEAERLPQRVQEAVLVALARKLGVKVSP